MTAKPTAIRGLSEISIDYSEVGVTSRTPAACVELLYVEHFTAIYRYLVLSGSSPADADEIAQETFLRLFTWLSRGQRVEKPRPWLMSVAHNLRLGELQRAARNAGSTGNIQPIARPLPNRWFFRTSGCAACALQ